MHSDSPSGICRKGCCLLERQTYQVKQHPRRSPGVLLFLSSLFLLQDGVIHDQAREHDGHHAQQLNEDVDGRARGILERVAHGVAHHAGLVALAALAAEVAGLDVLLGVVPGAAGVGHVDGHQEAGDGGAGQQTDHTLEAQHHAHHDGRYHGDNGGQHHLLQAGLGAQVHAARIIGIGLALHQARDLTELTAHLQHHALGRAAHRVHGQGGEHEGQAGADEQAHQHHGVHQGEVLEGHIRAHFLDLLDVGGHQSQSGQGGGADGEALAGGGSGVAQGVQCVCALAHLGLQAGHLGDAAGIISHRAVGVGGQGDAQSGQHTHGRQRDTVQAHAGAGRAAAEEEGQQDAHRHDDDGHCGGQHAQTQAADDDGGGTGLALAAQLLGGLIGVGGIVLGGLADQHAGHQAGQDGHIQAPVLQAQQGPHQEEGDDGDQDRGQVGAAGQRLQQSALVGVLLGLDEEGADDGADDAHGRHDHGDSHGLEGLVAERRHAQGGGGDDGAHIALVQVGAHASHVAHVVAHVVGNDGGVAGIVLGDTGFHLAHQVGAHVGSLGEDAAAHTGEQRHGAGAHAEGQHSAGDVGGLQLEHEAQQHEPDGDVEQAQAHHGEAHDAAGGERHPQTLVQAVAAGISGAAVGLGGDTHAHKAAEAGEEAAGQEREGHEPGQQAAGGHDAQHHDHAGEEDAHDGVLPLQVRIRALADGAGDLAHQRGSLLKAQHLLACEQGKEQCDDGPDKGRQNQVLFHVFSSFLPAPWPGIAFCSAEYYKKGIPSRQIFKLFLVYAENM